MSSALEFILYGDPIPLARPRVTKSHTYDKQRYQKNSDIMQLKIQHTSKQPIQPPIAAIFDFRIKKPAYKKKLPFGSYVTVRPDLDNYIKYYLDILQEAGIISEDSHVVYIDAKKRYSTEALTHILLETL